MCVPSDVPCKLAGKLCFENGLAGECRAGDNGALSCFEATDKCPYKHECVVKVFVRACATARSTSHRALAQIDSNQPVKEGDTQRYSADQVEERQGVCSADYRCVPRQERCSSQSPTRCYEHGREGRCVSKSVEQATQLAACLVENASSQVALTHCYASFSACFIGCSYPFEVCGPHSRCQWPRENQPEHKKRSTGSELVCQDVGQAVPLVERYRGNVLLIDVSGVGSNGDVASLVKQALYDNRIDSNWAYVVSGPDSSSAKIVLATNGVITLQRYAALELLALRLRANNGVHDAVLVVGRQRTTNPGGPTLSCTVPCVGAGLTCAAGVCLGQFPHGLCFDGKCVCGRLSRWRLRCR